VPEKSRDKCAIVGCHEPMWLIFLKKPICLKHWAMDGVKGFDLKVALNIKE